MEDTFASDKKGGGAKEDSSSRSSIKNGGLLGDSCLDCSESRSKRLVRRVNSQQTLILKVKRLQCSKSYIKDSFLRSIRALESWIPKHMVTVDEKYLRRCLELIHLSASNEAPLSISLKGWGEMGVLSDALAAAKIENEDACDFDRFHFHCLLASGNGGEIISTEGQWIVGSIMGSKSMVNILNSPLYRKYGAYDGDANFEKASFSDVDGSTSDDFVNSSGVLSNYSSNKLGNETTISGSLDFKSETLHERLFSMSSTISTSSDQSSSSSSSSFSAAVTQGMLQCTWKCGYPHFIFSLDDQKVTYVANLWKVESADDITVDYTYLFHLRIGGQKEHKIHDGDTLLVGKMKVSTSFTLCANNFRIMQREFVLFGGDEISVQMQTSSHDLRKNKGLPKRVADVFRTSHSMKKRTTSRFSGSNAMLESCLWEPSRYTDDNTNALCGVNLLENSLPPNLELAAIVMKDHLPKNCQEKAGGWGLNFLKKSNVTKTADTVESSQPTPGCCVRVAGDCSTRMDILIPAGLHGGPRTNNGGPSSLTERWKSGGCCDCGGWDLGCPLTVLKRRSSNKQISPQSDMQGECKSIDLVIQGSENSAPPLRMVNVYDGLYFVDFQSKVSALQSFAIAVALIHAQSPALRPTNVQELR